MSLSRAKQADQKWKDIVCGYVRRHAVSESITMPLLIQYLCLNYYWLDEQFQIQPAISAMSTQWGSLSTLAHLLHIISFSKTKSGIIPFYPTVCAKGSLLLGADPEGVLEYKWTVSPFGTNQTSAGNKTFSGIISACRTELRCVQFYSGVANVQSYSGVEQKDARETHDCKLEEHAILTLVLNIPDQSLTCNVVQNEATNHITTFNDLPLEKGFRFLGYAETEETLRLTDFSTYQA